MTGGTILLLGLLVVGAIGLVRTVNQPAAAASGPERILAERHARSDIDEQE